MLPCLVKFHRYPYYHMPCHYSSFKIFCYHITTRFLVLSCLIRSLIPQILHFPASPLFSVALFVLCCPELGTFFHTSRIFNLIEVSFLLKSFVTATGNDRFQ